MTVLVIAASEATPQLVDRWISSGDLPNLSTLKEEGSRGTTSHGVPYLLTPQTWATIATGRSPGHHGVFDYWQRGPDGRFRETHLTDLCQMPAWQIAAQAGKGCAVVNVPLTYPPPRVDGLATLSGQDAPGSRASISHPRTLHSDIVSRFGRYAFKDAFPGGHAKAEYARQLIRTTEHLTQVFEYLLDRDSWDLFVCYYPSTAMAQHYFWSDMIDGVGPTSTLVRDIYRMIDDAVGRLRKKLDDNSTIIVMSECGAGPIRSGVHVTTMLSQHGFLTPTHAGAAAALTRLAARQTLSGARRVAQRSLSDRFYYFANASPVKRFVQSYLATSHTDWHSTRAYYRGKGEGNIYINLRGRERHGIVEPGREYEDLRDELIERLTGLTDDRTGETAIVAVHRREALYDGPYIGAAPDLIIEWRDSAYMPTESDRDRETVFTERWREYMTWPTSGSHRTNGIFYCTGPKTGQGHVGNVRLVDIASILLDALEVEVPPELEGQVAGILPRNQDPGSLQR